MAFRFVPLSEAGSSAPAISADLPSPSTDYGKVAELGAQGYTRGLFGTLLGLPADIIVGAGNKLADVLGAPPGKIESPSNLISEGLDYLIGKPPEADTFTERSVQKIGEFAGATPAFISGGGALSKAKNLPTFVQNIGKLFASQPGLQLRSAVPAGLAAASVEELAPDSTALQILAPALAGASYPAIERGITSIFKAKPNISDLFSAKPTAGGEEAQKAIVGFDASKKAKLDGGFDINGNFTKDPNEIVQQASKLDVKFKDLKDTNFFESLAPTDTVKNASIKLGQFKENAGKLIGNITDEVADAEQGLTYWQAQELGGAVNPDFSDAWAFVNGIKKPALRKQLSEELSAIETAWESGTQSIAELKQFQQTYGLLGKSTWNVTKTTEENVKDLLNSEVYGALAGSLKDRIKKIGDLIGKPDLADQFSTANKAYSAATAFQNSAFNASRQAVGSKITKALGGKLGESGRLIAGTYAASAFSNPWVAALIAADSAKRAAGAAFPVQAMKLRQGLRGIGDQLNPQALRAGGAMLSEEPETPKAKTPTKSASKRFRFVPISSGSADMKTKTDENSTSEPRASLDLGRYTSSAAQKKTEAELPSTLEEGEYIDMSDKLAEQLMPHLIRQESAGNPKAVSNKGAIGLGQIMPATAKEIAKELGETDYDLTDPETNYRFAKYYLAKQIKAFDDIPLALAAYNAGPGAVRKYGGIPPFKETQNYVKNILKSMSNNA